MAFSTALSNAKAIVKAYQKGGLASAKRVIDKTGTGMNLSGARGLIKRHETMTANMRKPRKGLPVSKKKVVAKKKVAKKKATAKKKVVAKKKTSKKYSRGARA